MILGESMRAKGKDFAWEKRGINLEICHFIFWSGKFQEMVYAKLGVSSWYMGVLGQPQINKKYAPNELNELKKAFPSFFQKTQTCFSC